MKPSSFRLPGLSLLAVIGLLVAGCATGPGGGGPDSEPLIDTDGDGLFDVFEEEITTDPDIDDTDGDGYLDGYEWEFFTDPLDANSYDYLDGNGDVIWDHYPYPDDLEGEGSQWGDVAMNFELPDYWVQDVSLYSFYGNVIQVVATADT